MFCGSCGRGGEELGGEEEGEEEEEKEEKKEEVVVVVVVTSSLGHRMRVSRSLCSVPRVCWISRKLSRVFRIANHAIHFVQAENLLWDLRPEQMDRPLEH